jgi:hypothetical protein
MTPPPFLATKDYQQLSFVKAISVEVRSNQKRAAAIATALRSVIPFAA